MAAVPGSRAAQLRSAAIGVVVLLGIVALFTVAWNASKGTPWQSERYYTAAFTDKGALRVGQDVRTGQARIGRVSDITLDGQRVLVELEIATAEVDAVYRNASATVVSRSALGQKFVELDPGDPASGELPDGAVVPVSQTRPATKLTDVLQMFDRPTRVATATTVEQLGYGLAGKGKDLDAFFTQAPTMLPNLGTVSQALASNNGANVTRMLSSLDSLSARFAGRQQQISELVGNLSTTLDSFAADGGQPLRNTLEQAPSAMRQARTALRDLQQPLKRTTSAATKLEPGAGALAAATPDLRGVLREAQVPLGRVPSVAEQAVPGVERLTEVAHDAQPLAPKVVRGLDLAAPQVNFFSGYTEEFTTFFSKLAAGLEQGDESGHTVSIFLLPFTEAVTGNIPGVQDPTINRNAYQEPGEVDSQQRSQLENLPVIGDATGGGGQ